MSTASRHSRTVSAADVSQMFRVHAVQQVGDSLQTMVDSQTRAISDLTAQLQAVQITLANREAAGKRVCEVLVDLRKELDQSRKELDLSEQNFAERKLYATNLELHYDAEGVKLRDLCKLAIDEVASYKQQALALTEKSMLAEGQLIEARKDLKDARASKSSLTTVFYGMMALCVLLLAWVLYTAMMPAQYLAIKGPAPFELGEPMWTHLDM